MSAVSPLLLARSAGAGATGLKDAESGPAAAAAVVVDDEAVGCTGRVTHGSPMLTGAWAFSCCWLPDTELGNLEGGEEQVEHCDPAV